MYNTMYIHIHFNFKIQNSTGLLNFDKSIKNMY
jgi:hypothetical protein